jgi:hypothetical protein
VLDGFHERFGFAQASLGICTSDVAVGLGVAPGALPNR